MINPYDTETERHKERIEGIKFDGQSKVIIEGNKVVTGRKKAQWERILEYMQTHECITSIIASDVLRITSLHRRLTDIERKKDDDGRRLYFIDRKRIDVPNRPHHYVYRLK